MATGVTTANLDQVNLADEVIVNRDGSTGRMAINLLAAQIASEIPGPRYPTRAELYADLAWPELTQGVVWDDPTAAYNGLYRKSGASGAGSWDRYADLPQSSLTAAQLAALAQDIADEATARADADTAEATARANADTALSGVIATEVSARTDADAALAQDIADEATARADADTAEATARANADTALSGVIATEVSARTDADAALAQDIADEATARADADTAEATARANADTALSGVIATEVSARTDADAALAQDIADEATARADADTAEATARANADTALSGVIATEVSARTDADAALAQDIADEATARADADTALSTRIDHIAITDVARPGESPEQFSSVLTGEPEDRPAISAGAVAVNAALGCRVWRVTGADVDGGLGYVDVAPRRAYVLEEGRTYRLRVIFARAVDPVDPEGNGVDLRAQNLNANKGSVSNVRLGDTYSPTVAGGPISVSTIISREAGEGVEYVPPATTRHFVPHLRIYGNAQSTDPVLFEWTDITDLILGGADLADLRNDMQAADDALSGALAAETEARVGADSVLADYLTAEAQQREADDILEAEAREATVASQGSSRVSPVREYADGFFDRDGRTALGIRMDGLPELLDYHHASDRDALRGRDGRHAMQVSDELGRVSHRIGLDGRPEMADYRQFDESAGRRGDRYVGGFFDRLRKHALLAIRRSTGLPEMLDYHHAAPVDRAGHPFLWSVKDLAEQVVFGLRRSGRIVLDNYETLKRADRRGYRFLWAIEDRQGGVSVGQKPNGTVYIHDLESPTLDALTVSYPNADDWPDEAPVALVRGFDGYQIATPVDVASYAVRRNDGADYGLIRRLDALLGLILFGQSNAGFSGDQGGATITENPYPHIATTFSGGSYSIYGTSAVNEAALAAGDVKPITDAGQQNNTLVTLLGYALEHVFRTCTRMPGRGSLGFASWYGGQPLETFKKGEVTYENARAGARAAQAVAAKHERDYLPLVVFCQGESGSSGDYQTGLEGIITDLTADLEADLDLSDLPFFILQTNDNDNAVESLPAVELAQLAAADSTGAIVLGPMYQGPIGPTELDNIHGTAIARMVIAESMAHALWLWVTTGTFTPVRMLSAVRSGAVIDVTFSVPAGDLVFDDDWVLAAANYGFTYTDDTDSAEIASVEIIARDTVRITLDGAPSGANPLIQYALWQDDTDDGWASGRGQLYSSANVPSLFHQMGHIVPSQIRHYAVRDQIEVTI